MVNSIQHQEQKDPQPGQKGGKLDNLSRALCGAAASYDLGLMRVLLNKADVFARECWRETLEQDTIDRVAARFALRVIRGAMKHGYFSNMAQTLLYKEMRRYEEIISTSEGFEGLSIYPYAVSGLSAKYLMVR